MTATWLELCMDVTGDAAAQAEMADFWAGALGLRLDERFNLVDPDGDPGWGVALCPVPEAKTAKHRVHLDVHAGSVAELVEAGATVADEQERWTVLTDPQGGELCAFVREEVPARRLYEVCIDSVDAAAIGQWWAERFGVPVQNEGEEWCWLEDVPGMPFDALVFCPVPEPKTVKNRIHWDVRGDVGELLDAGARELWRTERWVVLADPEGNEFCVFPPE